jgi:hypothetical protein
MASKVACRHSFHASPSALESAISTRRACLDENRVELKWRQHPRLPIQSTSFKWPCGFRVPTLKPARYRWTRLYRPLRAWQPRFGKECEPEDFRMNGWFSGRFKPGHSLQFWDSRPINSPPAGNVVQAVMATVAAITGVVALVRSGKRRSPDDAAISKLPC